MSFHYDQADKKSHTRLLGTTEYFTSVLNAISITIPPGERFFITSINYFRNKVISSKLKTEIGIFIGQEKWHSDAHIQMNNLIKSLSGPNYERLNSYAESFFANLTKTKPEYQLAYTVSAEHFTTIISRFLLKCPELSGKIVPYCRKVWIQHACEELEHKSVAFDLLKELKIGYWIRMRSYLHATWKVSIQFFAGAFLLVSDSHGTGKAFFEFLSFTLNMKNGFIWHLIPDFISYLSPNFHPSQVDDSELVSRYLLEIEPEIKKAA